MKTRIDYGKMLLALKRNEEKTEFSGYFLRRQSEEMTPEQEEKVVDYCMKRRGRSCPRCVRDLGDDRTVLDEVPLGMNVSDKVPGICAKEIYDTHPE
ncbi:MAG: hypothetical protein OXF02_04855 [Simkaniaceae bacterium]|nr:hypothetical protein [Simkaniaceae bacterium]